MALTSEKIFVNLPVKNLDKSVEFFSNIGFAFNPHFTDENATCMVVSDHIFVMLQVEDYFKTFTKKELVDTTKGSEVIVALMATSRDGVDEIVNKAIDGGAKLVKDPVDHGFMYGWGFQDLDGHLWEVFYMEEGNADQVEA